MARFEKDRREYLLTRFGSLDAAQKFFEEFGKMVVAQEQEYEAAERRIQQRSPAA
jgi:hypothetical protein